MPPRPLFPRPPRAVLQPSRAANHALALALAALGLLAATGEAAAQPAAAAPATAASAPAALPDPDAGTPRPAAPDWRTGSIRLHGRAGLMLPGGSLASDVGMGDAFQAGPSFGAAVGIGLSRYLALEATIGYAILPGTDLCRCTGDSVTAGLGAVYHLTQGFAFDPWASYSVAYRLVQLRGEGTATPGVAAPEGGYHGIDVAQIAIGGDFYPHPNLGVGPFLELDVGTTLGRPAPDPGRAVHHLFQLGLRVVFDPGPKLLSAPAAPAASARRLPVPDPADRAPEPPAPSAPGAPSDPAEHDVSGGSPRRNLKSRVPGSV